MTKAKISEYDAVASNNTDVNGVNIAENCPPSGMNNMGREIMAALKRFQTGSDSDGVTVGGNLVVSGTSTVNTFTAGPVSATTLNTSGQVVFNDAGADVDFRVEGDTDANLLFVDASADAVGIGTASPSVKLEVAGAAKLTNGNLSVVPSTATQAAVTICTNTGGSFFAGLDSSTGSTFGVGNYSAVLYNGANTPLVMFTNGTERMRIDSDGNVGIGNTGNSSRKVEITQESGQLAGVRVLSGGSGAYYQMFTGTANTKIGSSNNTNQIEFHNDSGEAMRLDSSGSLLVGTTSAWFDRVLVAERASGDVAVFIGNTVGSSAINMLNTATSGDNAFTTFYTEARATPTLRGGIDYNRGAGLVRYNTTSDATLKNIIGDADGQKSVEILTSTKIREFAWKDDETQKPQIGVIAQELYETFKGAVSVGGDVEKQRDVTEEVEEEYIDEEGNTQTRTVTNVVGQEAYTEYRPWGVDKTAFTFHLVAGWQAHEKIIKQQAEMIAALEARIAALRGWGCCVKPFISI
jgi:hypothetical protein